MIRKFLIKIFSALYTIISWSTISLMLLVGHPQWPPGPGDKLHRQ